MITNICIDPTYYCNERCVSCRCNQITSEFPTSNALTAQKYCSIIDEFVDLGGESVSVYGGEPLTVEETFAILSHAKKCNLTTTITTNGVLLYNEKICNKLYETGVDKIIVSLMATEKMYASLHGKDYYERLINAIKIIQVRYPDMMERISFHVTIQQRNYNQLPNIIKLASQLSVRHVSFQYVSLTRQEDNLLTEKILDEHFENSISHWLLPTSLLIHPDLVHECVKSINNAVLNARQCGISLDVDPVFFKIIPQRYCQRDTFS